MQSGLCGTPRVHFITLDVFLFVFVLFTFEHDIEVISFKSCVILPVSYRSFVYSKWDIDILYSNKGLSNCCPFSTPLSGSLFYVGKWVSCYNFSA